MNKGLIISLEGLSNSGKTKLCKNVVRALKAEGYKIKPMIELTSPPGKVLEECFRKKIPMSPVVKALLFAADRIFLLDSYARLFLDNGGIIMTDRYTYTTYIYRMEERLEDEWLKTIEKFAPEPDLVLFIDITPEESLSRAISINKPTPYTLEFLTKIRKRYLDYVKRGEMTRVNGMIAYDYLQMEITNTIKRFIKKIEKIYGISYFKDNLFI